MAIVVVPFDSRFLDLPVPSLDLAVGPGMLDSCEPVLDPVITATHVEHVRHSSSIERTSYLFCAHSSRNKRRNLRARKPKSASETPLSGSCARNWSCSAIGSMALLRKRSTGRLSSLS